VNVLVVANPIAGAGKAPAMVERLAWRLEALGHRVDCAWTRGPGDAREQLRSREGGFDRLVVAGGDGTLNEVVNALPDPGGLPLTQLALGTANMLARELGLPRDPEALADVIHGGVVRRLDLGRVDGDRFLLVVGSGFDALVTRVIRETRRGTLGFTGYAVPIVRALARYRPPELVVRVDGGAERSGALVIVCNVRNYGGLFTVADSARCDSGSLEVCIFRRASVPDLVRYVAAARRGRMARSRNVEIVSGRRVRIASAHPVPVQVDGDYWGATPVEIDVEPAVVPVLVPAR